MIFDLAGEEIRFRGESRERRAAAAAATIFAFLLFLPFVCLLLPDSPSPEKLLLVGLLAMSAATPALAAVWGTPLAASLALGLFLAAAALISVMRGGSFVLVTEAFLLGIAVFYSLWRIGTAREALDGEVAFLRLQEKDFDRERKTERIEVDRLRARTVAVGARIESLEKIAETVRSFEQPRNVKSVAEEIVRGVHRALLAEEDSGRVILYRLEGGESLPLAASPPPPPGLPLDGEDFNPYAVEGGQNLLISDLGREFRFSPLVAPVRPVASLVVVPIRWGVGTWGCLRLESARPGAFDRPEVEVVAALAVPASLALQNAEVFARTEALAVTDGLTGLFRRHVFDERLATECSRSHRYGLPFSLLMADIDHFKSINDTFGHPAGDLVLKAVAQALCSWVSSPAWVARYGGEEFAVCLPDTPRGVALLLAKELRRTVEALPVPPLPRPVTLSIGVATYPDHAQAGGASQAPEDLIAAADRALYRAKERGRNRVETAESAPVQS